jgi:UDP-glucose-4-epimerase GalE
VSILITGGLGYIGSHTARLFQESGLDVVVLDNLVTGCNKNARWGTFIEGDISDAAIVRKVLRDYSVTAVLHLAASAHVGESMLRPEAYFANNWSGSLALLDGMIAEGVMRFVFASSCAVYGDLTTPAAHENEATTPVSPYGESKLATERSLPWYERAFGLRWVALRYFNAAGAKDGLGEDPSQSVRIIPRAIHAATGGPALEVFGTDFATPDGSAVRDYVHVSDVARSNLCALRYLELGNSGSVINIGSGIGVSVLEIIQCVGTQTGRAVPFTTRLARRGDPALAVSDPSRARHILGWTAAESGLNNIIASIVDSRSLRAETRTGNYDDMQVRELMLDGNS